MGVDPHSPAGYYKLGARVIIKSELEPYEDAKEGTLVGIYPVPGMAFFQAVIALDEPFDVEGFGTVTLYYATTDELTLA